MINKHNTRDCETCAAQYEADVIGALIPQHPSNTDVLKQQAEGIGRSIQAMTRASDKATANLVERLIQFAEEIKRQAVEL